MDEPRTHRVTLASISFTEIDVQASSVREAFTLAEQRSKEARLMLSTTAYATSAKIARLVDVGDPSKGIEWVVPSE